MNLRNIALALLCASPVAFAEEPQVTEVIVVEDSYLGEDALISTVPLLDSQPQFPGGQAAMYEWLGTHIGYPEECSEKGIQGRVVIQFTVFKDGTIGNVIVAKSVHPLLDAEAQRLVKSFPKWTPGTKDGENVNVTYTLPITFNLTSDPREEESQEFVNLGDDALAHNNVAHAFAYYKEAFNILPTQFYLIEKCDSLIVGDSARQIDFYKWAVDRLMREVKNDPDHFDDYLANAITLQEKVVSACLDDIGELFAMEIFYLYACDYSNVVVTAKRIYPLIPSNDIDTLAEVMSVDSDARFYLNDFDGVVNLVTPSLDLLFSSSNSNKIVGPIINLADAFIMLGNDKKAKEIIVRVKSFVPEDFDNIVESHSDYAPVTHAKFVELAK